MLSPNFIDEIRIYTYAGRGGVGSIHFRREKFVPKGGPDGGNGGRGGHIILRGNAQLSTLLHLKYQKHLIAENGKPGEGGCRTGASGKDLVVEVPLGTIAKDAGSAQVLLEITQQGQQLLLMRGGRGGRGNAYFKSSRCQAPHYAQPGEVGCKGWVTLELKLLADVGLVGLPNAGKSTLLSVLSAAKPKIADYPFTTCTPNLGIVPYREGQSFVLADIPGIIKGASSGKGLGTRFLRHVERNSILLFILAADTPNIYQDYIMLVQELKIHKPELLDKAQLVVVSKYDLIGLKRKEKIVCMLANVAEPIFISAVSGQGLSLLKDKIWRLLHSQT